MRTFQEIQNEYNMVCAQLGVLEIQKNNLLVQVENSRKPLLEKVVELQKEAEQVKLVNEELAKKESEKVEEVKLDANG